MQAGAGDARDHEEDRGGGETQGHGQCNGGFNKIHHLINDILREDKSSGNRKTFL